MLIRLFHLSGADLLTPKAVPSDVISEDHMVDDLEEQSHHPLLDIESKNEDTTNIHSKCENEE